MKTRTPVSSVILYIFGIIFMIVAAFMLWTAITYTKMYLASYETTFEEMWSNSVQYVIEKFLPYFSASVICFGLGKAISVFRKGLGARQLPGTPSDNATGAAGKTVMTGEHDEVSLRLRELREVGSIKLEEMERREKVRLDDMRETVVRDMALHRLQREAKEEEIISKLNALGEKMGLDMLELYARADIPVVPELNEEEAEGDDPIKNDPLFDELEKSGETAEKEETVEEAQPEAEKALTEDEGPRIEDEEAQVENEEAQPETEEAPAEDEETRVEDEDEEIQPETEEAPAEDEETRAGVEEAQPEEESGTDSDEQAMTETSEQEEPEQNEEESGETEEAASEEPAEETVEETVETEEAKTPEKTEADSSAKSQKPAKKKSKKQKKRKKNKKK